MSRLNEKLKERRAEALKKCAQYQNLFNSEEGKVVLQDLKRTFSDPNINTGDPHGTSVRVGELNVLRYINEVLNQDTTEVDPNE